MSALTDVMRVLASTPADFAALCLEVICSNEIILHQKSVENVNLGVL